ncbi:unnamed protein product [Cuscuta epithymum]|uniref:Uncharacterized protein n=1 Tax=Cuscuta epithymum TaxID=186058 RepID=A0AAV0CZT9_9ASTE|nr:unnamed protein product [Cuscuta epithymum]
MPLLAISLRLSNRTLVSGNSSSALPTTTSSSLHQRRKRDDMSARKDTDPVSYSHPRPNHIGLPPIGSLFKRQLFSMESNGKGVSIDGVPLPYASGEINFGEPGTNGSTTRLLPTNPPGPCCSRRFH